MSYVLSVWFYEFQPRAGLWVGDEVLTTYVHKAKHYPNWEAVRKELKHLRKKIRPQLLATAGNQSGQRSDRYPVSDSRNGSAGTGRLFARPRRGLSLMPAGPHGLHKITQRRYLSVWYGYNGRYSVILQLRHALVSVGLTLLLIAAYSMERAT